MKGNFDNTQPIFRQIIDQILLEIATGVLPRGSKVAPVREMALEYKVNPNTIQKSLAKLEEMGYMYTQRTSGRYVTQSHELIESLRARLPAQITQKYVADMLECGISQNEIPEYLTNYFREFKESAELEESEESENRETSDELRSNQNE